jgi:hypothetical protein
VSLGELLSGEDWSNECTKEKAAANHDTEGDTEDDFDTSEIISTNDEKRHSLRVLRNNVLDRLAETLARFKSDPRAGGGPVLGPNMSLVR